MADKIDPTKIEAKNPSPEIPAYISNIVSSFKGDLKPILLQHFHTLDNEKFIHHPYEAYVFDTTHGQVIILGFNGLHDDKQRSEILKQTIDYQQIPIEGAQYQIPLVVIQGDQSRFIPGTSKDEKERRRGVNRQAVSDLISIATNRGEGTKGDILRTVMSPFSRRFKVFIPKEIFDGAKYGPGEEKLSAEVFETSDLSILWQKIKTHHDQHLKNKSEA